MYYSYNGDNMKNNDLKTSLLGLTLGLLIVLAILGIESIFKTKDDNEVNMVDVKSNSENLKNNFIENAKKVYDASVSKFVSEKISGTTGEKYYSSSNNDLNIKDILYFVRINSNGDIVQMVLNDNNYKLIIGTITSNTPIDIEEIGNKYEAELLKSKLSTFIGDINKDGKLSYEDIETYRNNINKLDYSDIVDINNDGKFDDTDINEITNILIKGKLIADLNKDGKIDNKDLAILEGYVSNPETIEEENKALADINNDGKIDSNDTKQIKKSVSSNKKVKYVVKHWKQNITDDIRDDEHYSLSETQNLTATALTSVSPTVKSYNGFTSPSVQKTVVLSDGTTVINYYYKRNKYKYVLYINTDFESFEYTRTYDNFSKEINKSSNITYPYKILDVSLYYGETINMKLNSNLNDIIWTNGSNIINNGNNYSFKMSTSNVSNRIMVKPITYKILSNEEIECEKQDVVGNSSFGRGGRSNGDSNSNNRYSSCFVGDQYLVTFSMGQQTSSGNYIDINNVNIDGGNVILDVKYHYNGSCNALAVMTYPKKQILFSRKPDNLNVNYSSETCGLKEY